MAKKNERNRTMKAHDRKSYQSDPTELNTDRVQLWSAGGTMMGLIPLADAKKRVENGTAYVATSQAIGMCDR